VIVELRREVGALLLQRLEARLGVVGQLGTAQPEVAQLVVDQAAPGGLERRMLGSRGKRLVALEQTPVLAELGEERGDGGQVAVVGVAQRRRADDGVEVRGRAPGALEAAPAC